MKRLAGGSGERAGPSAVSWDSGPWISDPWISEISGSVVFLGMGRSQISVFSGSQAEIIPRSLNLRVIEFEIDAWLLGIFQAGFGISGVLERLGLSQEAEFLMQGQRTRSNMGVLDMDI